MYEIVCPFTYPHPQETLGATQSCNARLGAVWNGRTIRQHPRPKSGEQIQTPMAANDFSNRLRVERSPAVQRTHGV